LEQHEVYREIKTVDLSSVLPVLDRLQYTRAGQTGKYPCDVVVNHQLPREVWDLANALNLGGKVARLAIRKLAPQQNIPPHVDDWMPAEADWRRFQLPLVTHWSVVMRWPDDGVSVHLEAGKLYEVRYDRTHEVVNGADIPRIHLQIDQIDATI
jgi:hypothetical protein